MALIENEADTTLRETPSIQKARFSDQKSSDFWSGMSPRAAFLFGLVCAVAGTSFLAFLLVINSLLRR